MDASYTFLWVFEREGRFDSSAVTGGGTEGVLVSDVMGMLGITTSLSTLGTSFRSPNESR